MVATGAIRATSGTRERSGQIGVRPVRFVRFGAGAAFQRYDTAGAGTARAPVEELFASIPADLRLKRPLDIPPALTEMEAGANEKSRIWTSPRGAEPGRGTGRVPVPDVRGEGVRPGHIPRDEENASRQRRILLFQFPVE